MIAGSLHGRVGGTDLCHLTRLGLEDDHDVDGVAAGGELVDLGVGHLVFALDVEVGGIVGE